MTPAFVCARWTLSIEVSPPDWLTKLDKDAMDTAFTDIVHLLLSITDIAYGLSALPYNEQAETFGFYTEEGMARLRAHWERPFWIGSRQVSEILAKFLTTLNSSIKFKAVCSDGNLLEYNVSELSGVFLFLAEDLEYLLGEMNSDLGDSSQQQDIEGIEGLISSFGVGLKI